MKAQLVALAWAKQTYGVVVLQLRYQAFRFIEEAIELVQACGLSRVDVILAVDYVFKNPKGAMRVEIGDVLLSVDILAATQGFSTDECYQSCLGRIAELDPNDAYAKDQRKIAAGLI